jgi:integrase
MSAAREKTRYPGIYRRGGRYSYTYADHLGRQRYGSAATLTEARAAKAAASADVARGEFRALSKVTVAEFARSWISSYGGRTKRGINADTLADYRKALELDADGGLTGSGFLAVAGNLRMVDVTPADVKGYAARLAARGLARNTVRLAVAPLKAMFADAVDDNVIRWNPAAIRINLGSVADADSEDQVKALTREQLDALFDELPARWLPFFELLAEYGLRVGEAIELRGKDVEVADGDVIGGILHVRRRYYRGGIAPPKAGSVRHLRLEAGRARALREMSADPEALLFVQERGGRVEPSNVMRRVLKPAAVRAGIGEWVKVNDGSKRARTWVGFHTFRHTCATLKLREEGWSLEQVQVFLGHSSYTTTDRFYSHLTSKDAPVPAPIRRPQGGQLVAKRHTETRRDDGLREAAETA